MKTIRISFRGGPECGATRILFGLEPVIWVSIATAPIVVDDEGGVYSPTPIHSYCYMPIDEQDSHQQTIYEYRGEA